MYLGGCRSACANDDQCEAVTVTPVGDHFRCSFSSSDQSANYLQPASDKSTTYLKGYYIITQLSPVRHI